MRGNAGLYAIYDQTLYRESGKDDEGLGFFVRAAWSPTRSSLIDAYVDTGLAYKGLFDGRDDDTVGMSFAYARISDEAQRADRDTILYTGLPMPRRRAEAVIEATYQAVVVPGFTVQPDAQYVIRPGGGIAGPDGRRLRNAAVLGVRAPCSTGARPPRPATARPGTSRAPASFKSMLIFEWVVGVLFGAVLLAGLARRLGAPYPAFLALGGVGLAFVPGVPNLRLDPELALALFLAPVLLDAGFDASVRDLKENWRAVLGLAVGAVAVTTLAVAVVARLIVPDMPLSACIVLGAVVAPPDAVAALAVLKHAPMPHRLATILRGESLLNDAASLLIYRLGVAAAMAGTSIPPRWRRHSCWASWRASSSDPSWVCSSSR